MGSKMPGFDFVSQIADIFNANRLLGNRIALTVSVRDDCHTWVS